MADADVNDDLLDYEEEENTEQVRCCGLKMWVLIVRNVDRCRQERSGDQEGGSRQGKLRLYPQQRVQGLLVEA